MTKFNAFILCVALCAVLMTEVQAKKGNILGRAEAFEEENPQQVGCHNSRFSIQIISAFWDSELSILLTL